MKLLQILVLLALLSLAYAAQPKYFFQKSENPTSGDHEPSSGLENQYNANNSNHTTCEEEEENHWMLPVIFSLVMLCMLTAYLFERYHLVWVPESGVFIMIGIVIGVAIKYTGTSFHLLNFRRDWFFSLLLPPIILDSGYSMKKSSFFRNFGAISLFAVLGTLIATLFTGGLLYLTGSVWHLSYDLNMAECFVFGALISAIDPVATLATFAHVGAPDMLNSILAGESILNDAVAIVLFRTFEKFTHESESVMREIGLGILQFFYISAGSIAIGVLLAVMYSLLTKHTELRKLPAIETCLFVIVGYQSYLICEALSLSGIMALLFFGQTSAHYAYYNMSVESKVTTKQGIKAFAVTADTTVFVFLGMALWGQSWATFHWAFIGWTLLGCLVARALNVFPIAFFCNCFRKAAQKINAKTQLVMWFSGLRGAVAFALVMTFPAENDSEYRMIVSATLAVVLITTFIMGGGTLPLLRALGQTKAQIEAAEKDRARAAGGDIEMQPTNVTNDTAPTPGAVSEFGEAVPDDDTGDVVELPASITTTHIRPVESMSIAGPLAPTVTVAQAAASPVFSTPRMKNPGCFARLDEKYFKRWLIREEGIKKVKDNAALAAGVVDAKPIDVPVTRIHEEISTAPSSLTHPL